MGNDARQDQVAALDGTHILGPTALAITLGVTGRDPTPLAAPFALNRNGPAITLDAGENRGALADLLADAGQVAVGAV